MRHTPHHRPPTFAFMVAVGVSCSQTDEEHPLTDPAGPAVCAQGPADPSATVQRGVQVIGRAVEATREFDDDVYIVESGDNTIRRFDPQSRTSQVVVDVGNGRGPWDLWVHGDEAWITNFTANTVSVADLNTGEVVAELDDMRLEGPAGIAILGDHVYVGAVQFRGETEYGPGAIVVIDRATREVMGAIATHRQNPQALDVVDGKLFVVDSGAFALADGRYVAGTEGAVEVWTPTDDPLAPNREFAALPLVDDPAVGVPGRPAIGADSVVYLPSATGPVVFSYDVEAMEWVRGADDPIRLYDTDLDALHHAAFGPQGVLYVTAFNEDKLFLVDTTCDAVLDEILLEASEFVAGPHGVVPTSDGAYVVLSNANELVHVALEFPR